MGLPDDKSHDKLCDEFSNTLHEFPGDAPVEGADVSQANSGDLSRNILLNLTRAVVDAVQLGTLGSSLNLTILSIDVQEPLPEPESQSTLAVQ